MRNAFAGTSDAGTVRVRIQVIDVEPLGLDLVVPMYIPARDLTQGIARDADLGAYWPDGTRRSFWLRARGRLLQDHEKLQDLGVVAGELLHLLPQPPEGSGVVEQTPDYPTSRGYVASGTLNIVWNLTMVLGWTTIWAIALFQTQVWYLGVFPALGLSLLCTSFSRHLWGGQGSELRIPLTALAVFLPLLAMAAMPAGFLGGVQPAALLFVVAAGFLFGMVGVTLGWLAWFGPVEPLKKLVQAEAAQNQEVQKVPCGICAQDVDVGDGEIRADCKFGCGRIFHVGCYRARESVSRGTGCSVCGYQPQVQGL